MDGTSFCLRSLHWSYVLPQVCHWSSWSHAAKRVFGSEFGVSQETAFSVVSCYTLADTLLICTSAGGSPMATGLRGTFGQENA